MATLEIRLARPEDKLPDNTIRIHCHRCNDSTLHERVVRDTFTGRYRKPLRAHPVYGAWSANKATWKCVNCGKKQKF
jgi:hypothetical protein